MLGSLGKRREKMKRKDGKNANQHLPVCKASGRQAAGAGLPDRHSGAALSSAMLQSPKKAKTNVIDMQPYRDERELRELGKKLLDIVFGK